ncbi:MAG: ASPIC/UnbV domain-containing protein, partial [Nannocystaceae bacterium]
GQNQAWADIDHDGDLDLLVGGRDTGGGRPNFLFRNEIGHQNMWLAVRLTGDGDIVNRDAIGTRVTLTYGDTVVMRELKGSRGTYNSMDSKILHFG